jgi:hypothetical protein
MKNPPKEKLGSFYLGAEYDIENNKLSDKIVSYDARDLTTHAVCVGMTGSGKTGLCIGLLEEAALDKVPAIIIDPKGDMTNLLLQFEDMKPEDFEPWINPDDASRKDMSVSDYAKKISKTWSEGIASWGQGPERIKDLKSSVEYNIFTPGSTAGIPVNILGSFSAPKSDFDEDAEMIRERIQGVVAALLGMIGNNEDPVRSREGILLSNIFEHYWRKAEDLDLAKLIKGIQKPPISKLGVFNVEDFFPEKERFELAMDFNTLIASPQFKTWLEGTPLDIDKIYFSEDGKPRHSIFYIAHLSETERMFFVTLLLNALISWMRAQSGTTSLRSLLYFDEIFGFFPPTANPPSKKPLLTILKQARAFGVGAVLVTQNPVDIDYKGLSNAGTWFIGKLQTERDKLRLLEALEGAISDSAGSDIDYDKLISQLDSRVFLLHNVHEDAPQVFHTRWVLSYLRGPMTRPQVEKLMDDRKKSMSKTKAGNDIELASRIKADSHAALNTEAPHLDPSIKQMFLIPSKAVNASDKLHYRAQILAAGRVRYYDAKRNYDEVEERPLLISPPDEFGRIDWEAAKTLNNWQEQVSDTAYKAAGVNTTFDDVADSINSSKNLKDIEDAFSDYLYYNSKRELLEHEDLEIIQKQDESKESFLMRVATAAKEERDEELEELKEAYEKKLDRIKDKIRDEERDLYDAESDAQSRKQDELVNILETAASLLGKRRRRSFSSVSTKRRMSRRAADRVEKIREEIEDLQLDLQDVMEELEEKSNEIRDHWLEQENEISVKEVTPRRADVYVDAVFICWQAD